MPVAETNSPTWASNIQLGVQVGLRNTAVALPGIVLSYDEASQTATVQPAVNRLVPSELDPDEDESETIPAVQHVPVLWLVGRGIKVKATLEPGDSVLLIATDRDFSAWSRTGAVSDPDDVRVHHWQNAVAVPGLVPDTSSFPEPVDAAVLASKLDPLLRALSPLVPVDTSPPPVSLSDVIEILLSLVAAFNILIQQARAAVGGHDGVPGSGTTGSSVLKLEE